MLQFASGKDGPGGSVASDWLAIASIDLSLDVKEIVRIYGMRWGIEVFFKASKSLLKLGTEYQRRSYDMLIAIRQSFSAGTSC